MGDLLGAATDVVQFANDPFNLFGDEIGQFVSDPLDLSGQRAQATESAIDAILRNTASQNIGLQQEQLDRIRGITAPYRQAAEGTALPGLASLAFGGNVDYTPSRLFNQQLGQGRENILREQAARGGVKSSGTFERLSDLVSGLAAEDIGRYETGLRQILAPGQEAVRQSAAAGSALTGNIGQALANLGSGLNLTAQQTGQARQASLQGLSSGLTGLSQYLATRS